MTVEKKQNAEELTLFVSGRVDTTNAKEFEDVVSSSLDGIKSLIMDFSELEYISSAGLRVLLIAIKRMNKQGSMVIRNANEMVKEIFDVTGFSDMVDIE